MDVLLKIELAEVEVPTAQERARESRRAYKRAFPQKAKASERARVKRKIKRDGTPFQNYPFVGWDGEGVTNAFGEHEYVLFANSNGDRIADANGLRTERIFDFIFSTARKKSINVIYGAGYDWNMWLRDVPVDKLIELSDTGECQWKDYRLSWRKGKCFSVMADGQFFMFFDVVSFFQKSFVKACREYLGDRFVNEDMIAENKMLRSGFRAKDLEDIIRYNDAELVNLVMLMDELRARLYKVGLKPSRWDGPGAVAVALFQRERVKEHITPLPPGVQEAAQYAYFGGRFEDFQYGSYHGTVIEYDLNSAYPSAMRELPSLAAGRWEYIEGEPKEHIHFGMWNITYDGETNPNWPQPFPHREHGGQTSYPDEVIGWYWSPEYYAARDYCEKWGGQITVHGVWYWVEDEPIRPFEFVEAIYAERQKLKAAKDGAHVGIKLALNSMYGKTAQQVGWRDTKDGVKIPPYHNLAWAGYTTAHCRAQILRAITQNPAAIVASETDAVFTLEPLDLPLGEELGAWGQVTFDSLCYVQSGTYFGISDGEEVNKSRGFDRGELTRERVVAAVESGADAIEASLTRFIGLTLALVQGMHKWRTWETMRKNLSFTPSLNDSKRWHAGDSGQAEPCKCEPGKFHLTEPRIAFDIESAMFAIEWLDNDDEAARDEHATLRRAHIEELSYQD